MKRLPFLLPIPFLSACTVVHVGEGVNAQVKLYPGIAVVQIDKAKRTEIVSLRSFGLAVSNNQALLGYATSDLALVPPGECQIILWNARPGTADRLRSLFPNTDTCGTEEGDRQ